MIIAADLIIRNEEDYIEYCVDSIAPYIDVIFITDTGSTDTTIDKILKLMQKYPDKIILSRYEWKNDYSYMHNKVIDRMREFENIHNVDINYYLRVDCDEIYFHSVLSTLKDQLFRKDQIALKMPYLNFHGGHRCLDVNPYQTKPNICRFNNLNVRYDGQVHEFIYINGEHIASLARKELEGQFFHHYSWCLIKRRYNKKMERIKSESKINAYNNTPTQLEAINKFYSQFKDCPNWQMKGKYIGPYPEVLENSWLIKDQTYSVDNTMDSACVNKNEPCEYQCVVDSWEVSCSNYNYRKEHCL